MDDAPIAALVVWTLGCLGFTLLGVFGLRHPERLASWFRRQGTDVFGKKLADRVYTARNQAWALIPFVIMGPIGVVIGVSTFVSHISS